MTNVLITIAEVILVAISIGSLSFGIYLRRKIYLRNKRKQFVEVSITFDGDFEDLFSVYSHRPVLKYHRVQKQPLIKYTNGNAFNFEGNYSQELDSCFK